jgi:hypothetical protein
MDYSTVRNPLVSPALLSALQWLTPCQGPRQIEQLVRMGRGDAAAELVDRLIADADRP